MTSNECGAGCLGRTGALEMCSEEFTTSGQDLLTNPFSNLLQQKLHTQKQSHGKGVNIFATLSPTVTT